MTKLLIEIIALSFVYRSWYTYSQVSFKYLPRHVNIIASGNLTGFFHGSLQNIPSSAMAFPHGFLGCSFL
jgi:hypothetical protein